MRTVLLVTQDADYLARTRGALSKAGYIAFGSKSAADARQVLPLLDDIGIIMVDEKIGMEAAAELASASWFTEEAFRPAVLLLSERYQPGVLASAIALGLAGMWVKSETDKALVECLAMLLEPVGSAEVGFPMPRLSDAAIPTGGPFLPRDREWFESRLISEWGYSRQHGTPLALLMVGALGRERLLSAVGKAGLAEIMDTVELITRAELSSRDTVGRYDEGVVGILLAEAEERQAIATGTRLMRAFRETEFGDSNRSVRVRFAGGISIQDSERKRRWKDMKVEALAMLENRESRSLDSETVAIHAA